MLDIPSPINDFANSLRARHPTWGIEVWCGWSSTLGNLGVWLNAHYVNANSEWWESPLFFALDFTYEQMKEAERELVKWEKDFMKKVGD